ncbi:MAG: shikimate dehydrogenase [Campylobacterales bacterium]
MKLLGILGNPVSHSLSPLIHNAAIAELGLQPAVYTRLLVENGADLRSAFERHGLFGANITVPHKEEAFKQCDEVRGLAGRIGAVNTWVREEDRIIGYNTDAPGFMEAIAPLGAPKNALILGAGGTARAIAVAFADRGWHFTVVNRSEERLDFFRKAQMKTATWERLPEGPFDLIINTTSAGLKDDQLPLPAAPLEAYLRAARLAVDAIYGKQTPFLALAQRCGVPTQDGGAMLSAQAVLAFEHFFPGCDRAKVDRVMRAALTLPRQMTWR